MPSVYISRHRMHDTPPCKPSRNICSRVSNQNTLTACTWVLHRSLSVVGIPTPCVSPAKFQPSIFRCGLRVTRPCIVAHQRSKLSIHVRLVVLSSRHQILARDCANDRQCIPERIHRVCRSFGKFGHGTRRKSMRDDLVNRALCQGYPLRSREVTARVLRPSRRCPSVNEYRKSQGHVPSTTMVQPTAERLPQPRGARVRERARACRAQASGKSMSGKQLASTSARLSYTDV
jgi:hypothetical protein